MTEARANTRTPVAAKMLIGGEWVAGNRQIEVFNPARPDELVGTVPRCTPDDVNAAVAAAKAAQPAWARKSFTERAEILARGLTMTEEGLEERAALFVRENGKTHAEAKGELSGINARLLMTLELAAELDEDRKLPAPHGRTFIGNIPFGVVVSIVPWNAPVTLAAQQVIPALLAGNGVVLKPPETCPLGLIDYMGKLSRALPPGILNMVTGLPAEIGDALTRHPDVDKIGFTGSIPAAAQIMANAAQTIKGITLELGGNDPAILLEDADLGPETMQRMVRATYRMTGQVCMAIKRVYVPESMSEKFLEAFGREVDKLVVGDGLEPQVGMGPMHTARALERAQGLVADTEASGARVHRFGKILDEATFKRGHFMQPMVATEVAENARLMREEQFCPLLPVTTYRDLDDAIERANDTIYGLSGSVWSRDVDSALSVARRIEAGSVFVNTHGTESVNRRAPYGGVKQSGIGRRAGIEGVREYMQVQTLTTFE
ncbi:MAG TPA: aldehyde dehydrogenase family protein [Alphaproteobacteria bacterium]|jgi:acyl-CoA reductase-like NAD-dependent aldehyde dehydrogenase